MKRSLLTSALLALGIALSSAPAHAGYSTADFRSPSSGSYGFGSDGSDPLGTMIGAAFVVSRGQTFHMTGIGANFDGNFNQVPGQPISRIFVALIPLVDGTTLPTFGPGSIAANAIAGVSFVAPSTAGDFVIPFLMNLGPGAYAAVFGSAGFFGSNTTGEEGLQNDNATIGNPFLFSNFGDTTWSAYQFDTGIRIFEAGAVVPEPATVALFAVGLGGLLVRRRRRA